MFSTLDHSHKAVRHDCTISNAVLGLHWLSFSHDHKRKELPWLSAFLSAAAAIALSEGFSWSDVFSFTEVRTAFLMELLSCLRNEDGFRQFKALDACQTPDNLLVLKHDHLLQLLDLAGHLGVVSDLWCHRRWPRWSL